MKTIIAILLSVSLSSACWMACTTDEKKADDKASACRKAKATKIASEIWNVGPKKHHWQDSLFAYEQHMIDSLCKK